VHPDHLGTPRVVVDAAGVTVWRWDNLEPFGLTGPQPDPDGNGQAFVFNLRFAGQYFDAESGLFHNRHRDYDSASGRYVQADPIGLAGGISLYSYVGANPLGFVDPLGLARCEGGSGFGSGKPPHTAEVTVVRNGEVVSQQTLKSGGMSQEEAALGFPRSSLATHTEARAVRSTPLQAGDAMTIKGQYARRNQ